MDITILGGGIVGAMLTRTLALKFPNHKIALLEKESALGLHTSTRNSAVLHAGFYYNKDSIKAKLCREGNKTLTSFCKDNQIAIKETGKFLVARNAIENDRLLQIKKQGDINQVELELMNAEKALKIEKYLRVHDPNFNFLYSPTTRVADNKGIMKTLESQLSGMNNVKLLLNTKFNSLIKQDADSSQIEVNHKGQTQQIQTKYLINSGGLYADIIAKQFNFGAKYTIWPFRGSYLTTNQLGLDNIPQANAIIYPVPPLVGNYFLGIHTTLTVDGHFKIGPSICPALWREQYSFSENFKLLEFLDLLQLNVKNTLSKDMKQYMESLFEELKKLNKDYMIREAMKLTTQLDGIEMNKLKTYFERGRPGIRSQLYDTTTKTMVQDFIIEHDKRSLHLLNVASPGWTCSIPMADHIGDIIEKYI